MIKCTKCNADVPDSAEFCPECGSPIVQPTSSGQSAQSAQPSFQFDTADTTADFDPADIEANKVMALLSYLGILFLVPLLAAKESKFARFHANQGIILCITSIAYSIVRSILVTISYIFADFTGALISKLLSVAALAFLVLAILGIVNAVQGKAKELPVIGSFKILK